jgi:hypothetical protein
MNQCLYYEDGKGSLPLSLIDCFLFFFLATRDKNLLFTVIHNNSEQLENKGFLCTVIALIIIFI